MNIHNPVDGDHSDHATEVTHRDIMHGANVAGGVGATLDRRELATPIKVVEFPNGTLRVRADGIISDHDETISIGTGEHFHDGHLARFAQGLSLALLEHHGNEAFLSSEYVDRYRLTNSLFGSDEWATYKSQSGKSEDQVLRGMLEVAFERFGLDRIDFQDLLERFTHHSALVVKHSFQKFMENVSLDQGLASAFQRANEEGVPVAVCSASQEHVVIETLKHFNLVSKDSSGSCDVVEVVIGNAVKKVDAQTFCGAAVEKACAELGVKPARAVMFGDSIGDVAAAARAGIGTIFICLREPHALQALKREIDSFQRQERYNKELIGRGDPITVYLVDGFDQVEIEGRLPSSEKRATCFANKTQCVKDV